MGKRSAYGSMAFVSRSDKTGPGTFVMRLAMQRAAEYKTGRAMKTAAKEVKGQADTPAPSKAAG